MKVFLSYALALGGLGLVVAAVLGAYMINLSYPAARLRMMNTLRMSVNQAEVMCRAAKGTFYEPLGEAIKIGVMAATNDLKIIQASTKPGYDAGCISVKMAWKKLYGRGQKGVLAVIGGLVLAISIKAMPAVHIIATVLAVAGALWFVVTRTENERSLVRAKAELLPELDRAFAEGRYQRYG